MATEPDEDEHEDLTIDTEADQPEPDEAEAPEGDEDEPPEGDEPPEDDDEIEISFGDGEPAPARGEDSAPIRALREENRRQARELAELRRASEPKPVELGPKPTLEACEWDEDKFASETEAWLGRKSAADAEQQKQRQQQETAQQAWQEELADFARKGEALKVKNFPRAVQAVEGVLNPQQQTVIIQAADNSAKVIYALGMHPEKLADLAKITNLVKFTAAIVKLEGNLQVTPRRQAPAPDRPARGSAPFSAANGKVDKHLEKLEAAADKSGDRTAVVAYKRDLREKAAKTPRR